MTRTKTLFWLSGLAAVILLMATGFGCVARSAKSDDKPLVEIPKIQRSADKEAVVAFLPASADTVSVLKGFRDEVGEEFDVVAVETTKKTTEKDIAKAIKTHQPKAVLLMNNTNVRLYKKYQSGNDGAPPAVVVMASFVEKTSKGLKNARLISYEVAGVTSMVNLRSFIDRPVKKIGVIHRESFADFVAKHEKLAAQEKFEFVTEVVPKKPTPKDIKKALESLRAKGIDAVWILNDNALLKPKVISKGWLPSLKKDPLPVMVGVRALVSKSSRFGSFAVVPDHVSLGAQAGNTFFEIVDNDFQVEEGATTELPVSVEIVMDVYIARKHLSFKEELISQIDRVVE